MKKKDKETPVAGASYKGKELHRYPLQDQKDRPLPSHLWVFLFPTGVQLEEHTMPPRFFVNALTYSDGTRSYVISIKFYEKTSWSLVGRKNSGMLTPTSLRMNRASTSKMSTKDDAVLYAPKAICYVTQLPLFSFFKRYLSEIFLLSQPSSISGHVPLERYISQLVMPIPIGGPKDSVFDKLFRFTFTIGKTPIPCVVPNLAADFCITDVSFRYLFQALSVETVITLLAALLTEQKILFHSQHYVLLITVLQSLIDLLLPFQWPHTYIPTVPSNLLEFVDAPTPYVMGVHADQMESLGPLEDVIVVDCDRHTVSLPSFFVPLPDDLKLWMTEKLNKTLAKFGVSQKSKDYIEAEMEKIDLAFARGYEGSSSDAEFTLEVRMCTMALYARMFFNYERYVNKNSTGGRMTVFDEPSFTKSRDARHRVFVAECACRSVFEMFLSSPDAKLFSLLTKLALTYGEDEVFNRIEKTRKSAEVVEVEVPVPPPGDMICSYNHFPSLDEARYVQQKTAIKAVGSSTGSSVSRIYSEISSRVRTLAPDNSSKERITLVDTLFSLLKGMHHGTTDATLAARVAAWFVGEPVRPPEAFEQRGQMRGPNSPLLSGSHLLASGSGAATPTKSGGNGSAAKAAMSVKQKMKAVAKKLKPVKGSQLGGSAEVIGSVDGTWQNPDSWDAVDPAASAEDPVRREAAREAMGMFVQMLRFYCEAGEVKFARGAFRDLCKLLRMVVSSCDRGLQHTYNSKSLDTNSSADDDTETGVAVCWACGEVNRSNYAQCASCSEPPLGSGLAEGDDGSSVAEEKGRNASCAWLHEPRGEEKAYFAILKGVVAVGSSLCYSTTEGFALQQFSVETEGWSTWARYDFWQYCIFSDYCDKTHQSSFPKDPKSIPAYPDLFPVTAFYLNAMVSVRMPAELATSFLARLPFETTIRETLSQLSYRLYESHQKSASSSPAQPSSGVRVMNRNRLIESRKNIALQMSKAAQNVPLTPASKRPPVPSAVPPIPIGNRRTSLTEDEM